MVKCYNKNKMKRKNPLVVGQCYHIISRSIAGFRIFNDDDDYLRMFNLLWYYQIKKPPVKFSHYLQLPIVQKIGFQESFQIISKNQEKIIVIIAYCLMPTHIHLILKELSKNGTSSFMGRVLNSYSSYFNLQHRRQGPLWESRFKNILIETDEQLLHLTRYLHLNPVTAGLVKNPGQWSHSSYLEYIDKSQNRLTNYEGLLDINPQDYQHFVKDRIAYQRDLAKIKKILLET